MEAQQFTWKDHLVLKQRYYDLMKSKYLEAIEKAKNKEIAQKYYRENYLKNNTKLPYYTFIFDQLTKLYDLHSQLNEETSFNLILSRLEVIEREARQILDQVEYKLAGDVPVPVYINLPDFYASLIEKYETIPLKEIVNKEEELLSKLSPAFVFDLLAVYAASKELLIEFPEEESVSPIEEPEAGNLTHFQVSLIMTLLLSELEPTFNRVVNFSELAKFIHRMTNRKFTTAKNSEVYSKLLYYHNRSNNAEIIKILQSLRVDFVNLKFSKIVKLIDRKIEELSPKTPSNNSSNPGENQSSENTD